MPAELAVALAVEALCRRYPAYTPETAAAAPAWVWGHLELLALAEHDTAATGSAAPPEPQTQAEWERMLFG